jgi:LPXTG-site transpeptidase (sortase) family protein
MFASKISKLIIPLGLLLLYHSLSSIFNGLNLPRMNGVEVDQSYSSQSYSNPNFQMPLMGIDDNDSIDEETTSSIPVEKSESTLIPTTGDVAQAVIIHSNPKVLNEPQIPVRIAIPAIQLEAPVMPAETEIVTVMGKGFMQWLAPNAFAAGWHKESARLGERGNLVLNGHNNLYGEVFKDLDQLVSGDLIYVYSEDSLYQYQIANSMILAEKYQELDIRMNNAQWILPSEDQRLTLVSCWPYNSNSHRVIIVARPYYSIPEEMK